MPKGNTLSRLAIASLAAAALAAPAASAQPMDMHASTVHKPAPAKQDLRGEAASGQSSAPINRLSVPSKVDLRGEAAVDSARAPVSRATLAGPPTWPMYPTPLPTPQATTVAADDGDGGIDIPLSVLIIAGTLAAAGAMGAAALRIRTRPAY
jgi:hypothetical protein